MHIDSLGTQGVLRCVDTLTVWELQEVLGHRHIDSLGHTGGAWLYTHR